jgi:hypothetical protein
MRYLKTFEANSHWSEFLYDKVKFVTKTLGDKYSVTKVSNNQNDESILSLKIGYK